VTIRYVIIHMCVCVCARVSCSQLLFDGRMNDMSSVCVRTNIRL